MMAGVVCSGAEYWVAMDGSDGNDGLTPQTAFATVQRGVDALGPGDTLTIAPGEYFGAVSRTGLGRDKAGEVVSGVQTVIRAAVPGSVVLRGDVPAPEFRRVDGMRFVYVAEFDGGREVQAVNEFDTLTVLRRMLSPAELEFNPGHFYQDREAGLLYISPSDLRPSRTHRYTLSVEAANGLYLKDAHGVVVEGLSVVGFNTAVQRHHSERGHGATWGIFLAESSGCVVRNCTVAFNGRGVGLNSRSQFGNNRIEHCTAWANQGVGGGAGLSMFEPNNDEIAYSTAFVNDRYGLLIYTGSAFGRLYKSLSWGNEAAVQLKADKSVLAERTVGVGKWGAASTGRRAENSLIGDIRSMGDNYRNNILLSDYPDLDLNVDFADPLNHDYRLQSTSRFRGAAEDGGDLGPFPYEPVIHYVSPDGDDEADGLSVITAWRTLPYALSQLMAGDTLYLEPGEYEGGVVGLSGESAEPTRIRGRGFGDVIINGSLELRGGTEVEFERLTFRDPLIVRGAAGVGLQNCRLLGSTVGLEAVAVDGLQIEHSLFSGFSQSGVRLEGSLDVYIQNTVFANAAAPAIAADNAAAIRYSDFNAFQSVEQILAVGGQNVALARQAGGMDANSTLLTEVCVVDVSSGLPVAVAGLVAAGQSHVPVGPWNPAEALSRVNVLLAGPYIHFVSATTANIEWWTSVSGEVAVAWGTEPGPDNFNWFQSDSAGTFSLSGLDPDTEYFVTIAFPQPVRKIGEDGKATDELIETAAFSFRTAAADRDSVTWYVASDGDDANSGRSIDQPFRTVNHAATVVAPGDTVIIRGGTYHESVRVRATGDIGRPITFRSMPGEKVVFDGFKRNLTYGFLIANKDSIQIDGLYFTDLGRGGVIPWNVGENAAIMLYRSDNISITRCLLDGRGSGPYSPGLVWAVSSNDVLVKNCVISGNMGGGVGFAGAPGMCIENCVFLRGLIGQLGEVINAEDQPFIFRNNIVTDSLPKKQTSGLLSISRVEAMEEDNNLYYLRIPEDERRFITLYGNEAFTRAAQAFGVIFDEDYQPVVAEQLRLTLAEFRARFNPDSTSFVGDPAFAATVDMARVDEDGNPVNYLVDQLVSGFNRGIELDFNALFSTDPEVLRRNIGLQPEAFGDFHFAK